MAKDKTKLNGTEALQALDRGIEKAGVAMRWRIVAENAPTGSKISAKAHDSWQRASNESTAAFNAVRAALGFHPPEAPQVDPPDDPAPERHWDAGA